MSYHFYLLVCFNNFVGHGCGKHYGSENFVLVKNYCLRTIHFLDIYPQGQNICQVLRWEHIFSREPQRGSYQFAFLPAGCERVSSQASSQCKEIQLSISHLLKYLFVGTLELSKL